MDTSRDRQLFVVLGIPRGGTTAMAEALGFAGVAFESDSDPDRNGGAWSLSRPEEAAINEELLKHLGASPRGLLDLRDLLQPDRRLNELSLRALQFVSARLGKHSIFGLTDSATSRLLEFWNPVLSGADARVSFIILIRNPASVVTSLEERDGIPVEKGYFLWLQHVLTSVLLTRNTRRAVVDYDELLADPQLQIERLSTQLHLPVPDPDHLATKLRESGLLGGGRRKGHTTLRELALDRRASSMVAPIYELLHLVATDRESLASAEVHEALEGFNRQLRAAAPAFAYISTQEEGRGQLSTLLAQRDARILELGLVAAQRGDRLAGIEEHIAAVRSLAADVTETLAERNAELVRLSQVIRQRENHIAQMHRSNSWRITSPLRSVTRLIRRNPGDAPSVPPAETEGLERWGSRSGDHPAEALIDPVDLPAAPPPVSDDDKVPADFDSELYLELHPDLAVWPLGAAAHYVRFGRFEGRGFLLPELSPLGEDGLRLGRPSILVVSHEASRTGAPLLSLNLVQGFAKRYNVVALLLGDGPLCESFKQAGAAVVISPRMKGNPVVSAAVIRRLHHRFAFEFALVNSIESRVVLDSLGQNFVPTISLLHEFAAYTRPRDAFRDAFLWSTEVVFSAKVTLENALNEHPDLAGRSVHVLPQGRCVVPLDELTESQLHTEQARIRRTMRPEGDEDRAFVVLGAGTVHIRKGVDLFIQAAARVKAADPGRIYRFVWIGAGFDPVNDAAYSVYIADQIRRAGLEDVVVFIDETVAIETAYEEADLLLLSSRLDPLPNVAIEAMALGTPVLCFNGSTGIADFLIDAGLKVDCVADYLDSADMASKVVALASSDAHRARVGARCKEASSSFFGMTAYLSRLRAVAHTAAEQVRQEKEDIDTILQAGAFDGDFATPPHLRPLRVDQALRRYVRGWASGVDRRKPFSGFHPGIYLEQHGLKREGADPLAEYLRMGRPAGPWNFPVIVPGSEEVRALPDRVALHLHVHYAEMLSELLAGLSQNRIRPDLFVSVTSEGVLDKVAAELERYPGNVAALRLVPNRGRNLGPLLTEFGSRIIENYEFVGHLHTKRTADVKDADMGRAWFRFLLENLLGGDSGAMADRIVSTMAKDHAIGMVFPDDPHVVGWTANRSFAEPLASRIGLGVLPEHFNFPVGAMFWARTQAIAPWVNPGFDWDDYPAEPLPYDGSLLHAIERLLPLVLPTIGLRQAVTSVEGVTR